jgi:hypothetical protein
VQKGGGVVKLYQDYGRHEKEAFRLFMGDCREKYQKACPNLESVGLHP